MWVRQLGAWAVFAVALARGAAIPMFPEGRTLNDANFTMTQQGAWLVEYFSPACPHCQRFAPVWAKLEEAKDVLRKDPNAPFTMARVNCMVSMDLCEREQVTKFPQISLYYDGKQVERDLAGSRTYEALSTYVDNAADMYRGTKGGAAEKAAPSAAAPSVSAAAATGTASAGWVSAGVSLATAHVASAAVAAAPLVLGVPSLAPFQTMIEYGSKLLPSETALTDYLGTDRGQGPSFVKCTSCG